MPIYREHGASLWPPESTRDLNVPSFLALRDQQFRARFDQSDLSALDAMGKLDDPFFGNIPPHETVKLVFNLSQDEDVRGPWNRNPISTMWLIRIRKGAYPCRRSTGTTKAMTRGPRSGCGANVVGRAIRGLEVGTGHAASTAFQISEAVLFLTRSLPSLN